MITNTNIFEHYHHAGALQRTVGKCAHDVLTTYKGGVFKGGCHCID